MIDKSQVMHFMQILVVFARFSSSNRVLYSVAEHSPKRNVVVNVVFFVPLRQPFFPFISKF